ncbi:Mariner Mos1 transposase [Eumeta japonica]|uniref:Mariner Mos1 transposase n=1 Tax=Eumeta variegata TaxID=151549 RepID=A0A4C1XT89_EUMVA|nr:Mariner Mos1 transposase [Eumeta japonica]
MTLDVQVYFVIPNGCEQDECSEEMHQAYITCEQHRGGGLNARWILEDDCMRLQNVTKKDVFVLEEFDGAVFEKLKSSKCLLVGPRCLSCCLMEGVAIPSGPEPVFTVAMRGLIVTASGLTKLQKKSVELGIPIMSITWVTDVWDTSLTMNVNGNSMEFNKHRLKPFNNLHITTSGIGKKEKQSIIKLVTENGGTFTGAFQSETTDIVIMTKEGIGSEKYKAAIEFGKACVHPLWIQHSVERHYAQPVAKYKIAGASTSSPLAHHNLPDISLNFSRITNSRPTSNVVNETTDSSVIASCRTKLSQEVKKTNDSQLVDKDIMIAFEKFDMNSIKKAGPVFDGFFVWVVGGSGICRERACGLVSRGGGVRYDCPGPRVTHAVAMSAAAATKAITELPNVPVVSAIWLIKSVEAEKALDVTEFLMNEEAAGNTSGSTKKSRLEPSSPLSKKNLQMLRPPCPPPPAFNDNLLGNVQDDILQQYKSHTSATTSSKSNISSDPRPNVTEVTGSGEEEPTEEPEQIFEGIKFEVQSLDEETLCELSAEITASGGILLPTGGGGSHALVPLDFDVDELANKNAEAVTVFWVKDCLTQQELVPIQYYHKPVRVVNATALHDVVLSLSTYSGVERAFLDELATLMGATTQLRFCRRAAADALASTHLLCPEPTGDKYAGAVRWGLPAVTARWLLDCAAAGKRLHEQLYLVGDTKAPSLLTPDETKDKENVITIEKRKSVSDNTELRDSSKEHTPRVKQIDIVQGGVDGDVDMSPASRYIAMARQGLLNADSQETPKRMKDVQQEQVAEGVVRTPPLDEALSTPNLAALSPTTRRRIQAVRRGEMPSDPIRTPKNPCEPIDSAPGTPDSAFGAALRPGSGLSPGTRKRLWRQVQHLPGKQPSPAVNKQTPLSEIRNRFLAQFAEGAPTPPTDHGLHGPRKLQLPDQSDTPPAKIPKFLDNQFLLEAYDEHALAEQMCRKWFARFKSGDFELDDKERPGQPKKFEDKELQGLLDVDSCQTLQELATSLVVDLSKIHYDNPKRRKSWVKPGQPSTSVAKQNIHGSKLLLCIWWDQRGVIYYELLKPNETITGDRYRLQLIRLSRALKEKRSEYSKTHDKVILLHDNARPHVAKPVKTYLGTLKWDVLPHPPYAPDIVPSDYHLFRSMAHGLTHQKFTLYEDCQKWVDLWISSKDKKFFQRGIHLLPERWQKVVESDGKYFE